jgi:hypothetical protein
MARTGIYALIDELKNAVSTEEASRRIDQFVLDLEGDAKQCGWPEGKIATHQANLRKLIKAAVKEEKRRAVRSNFQAALNRLAERRKKKPRL